MAYSTYETLLLERDGNGITTLTLNRPDRLNAASHKMVAEVPKAILEVGEDLDSRVLVITGAGRGFSSGQDMKGTPQDVPGLRKRYMPRTPEDSFTFAIRKIPQPVIASVNGPAVGWGLSLAAAAQIRIASEQARFGALWVARGLPPEAQGGYLLPQIMPLPKVFEMVFLGKIFDAKEAKEAGLINILVPHSELKAKTHEIALQLAKGPPIALAMAKRAIYMGLRQDLDSFVQYESLTLRVAFQSEDRLEGIRSFVEKREPRFKGE